MTTAAVTSAVTSAEEITDPTLTYRERKVTIQYQSPHVNDREIKSIAELWKKDVPVIDIIRRMQSSRSSRRMPPLIYMDVYTILFLLMKKGEIGQRRAHEHELTIKDFSEFFKIWKKGGSLNECMMGLSERPPILCKRFAEHLFRSINDRYRREKKLQLNEGQAPNSAGRAEPAHPLSTGKQINVHQELFKLLQKRDVEGQPALVIFLHDIPAHVAEELKKTPEKLLYNPSVMSGESFFKEIAFAKRGIDVEILDPDDKTTDEAANLTQLAHSEKESRKKLKFNFPRGEPEEPKPYTPQTPDPVNNGLNDDDDIGDLESLLDDNSDTKKLTLENLNDDD